MQDHWTYACNSSHDYDTCANVAKATCNGMSNCMGFTVPKDPSWRQNILVYPGNNDNDQCVWDNLGFSTTWDFFYRDLPGVEHQINTRDTVQINGNE